MKFGHDTVGNREFGQQNDIEQMFDAVKRGGPGEVEKLLREGLSPATRDKKGRTLLMTAAEAGWVEMVRLGLDHGADVNAMDVDGETALMKAAYGGHLSVVELLVLNGADLGIRNNEGLTALETAQEMDSNAVSAFLSAQSVGATTPIMTTTSGDPVDDDSTPNGPAGAAVAAAMTPSPEPRTSVQDQDLESIPEPGMSADFGPHQQPDTAGEDREEEAQAPPQEDESEGAADLPGTDEQAEEAGSNIQSPHDDLPGSETRKTPTIPDNILAATEERIEFDALDNKQVRNINEKIKRVLDKAGFEVGDYVVDTVFKGSYIAVLKPRSQENKRWRKLKKHPDWVTAVRLTLRTAL